MMGRKCNEINGIWSILKEIVEWEIVEKSLKINDLQNKSMTYRTRYVDISIRIDIAFLHLKIAYMTVHYSLHDSACNEFNSLCKSVT